MDRGRNGINVYEGISDNKFKIVRIGQVDDIWKEFNKIFGGNKNV